MSRFLSGFFTPLKAFALIARNKKLIGLSVLPVAVTAIIYVLVLALLIKFADTKLDGILSRTGLNQDNILYSVIHVLIAIVLIMASMLTFSLIANLVATPFNDLLAEAAEAFARPPLAPVSGLQFKDRVRQIWIEFRKSLVVLLIAFFVFLFSLIPIVGLLGMLAAPMLLAYEFASYPQTRRSYGIRRSLGFLRRNAAACFGFGLMCSVLFLIPFVSCLTLPLAVVGGMMLFAKYEAIPAPAA
jgi:CysZ protein